MDQKKKKSAGKRTSSHNYKLFTNGSAFTAVSLHAAPPLSVMLAENEMSGA